MSSPDRIEEVFAVVLGEVRPRRGMPGISLGNGVVEVELPDGEKERTAYALTNGSDGKVRPREIEDLGQIEGALILEQSDPRLQGLVDSYEEGGERRSPRVGVSQPLFDKGVEDYGTRPLQLDQLLQTGLNDKVLENRLRQEREELLAITVARELSRQAAKIDDGVEWGKCITSPIRY